MSSKDEMIRRAAQAILRLGSRHGFNDTTEEEAVECLWILVDSLGSGD